MNGELAVCTHGPKNAVNRPLGQKNRGILQKIRGFLGSWTVRKRGVSANLQKLIGFGVSERNKPGIHFARLQNSTGNPLFRGGKSGRFCLSSSVDIFVCPSRQKFGTGGPVLATNLCWNSAIVSAVSQPDSRRAGRYGTASTFAVWTTTTSRIKERSSAQGIIPDDQREFYIESYISAFPIS